MAIHANPDNVLLVYENGDTQPVSDLVEVGTLIRDTDYDESECMDESEHMEIIDVIVTSISPAPTNQEAAR